MKNFLKHEKVNTLKSIFATFIDLVLTAGIYLVLFYCAITPLFRSTTPLGTSQDYLMAQNKVVDVDDKVGYDLTLPDGLGYERYILEAKCFYEYYEDKIVATYSELAAKDENVPTEYKDRFKDIHLIYNFTFLGLDYKADPTEESSYSNAYFIYKFDETTKEPLWNEYGIDNPRTLDLNERGKAERNDYVYLSYSNLTQILTLIDSTYAQSIQDISVYTGLSSLTSFLISYSIFYIAMPLILRNNATIGKKIFGYGYINKNGSKVSWYKGLCKSLISLVLPAVGIFFTNVYTLVILVIFPIFINLMYYVLAAREQDILDRIFRMEIIDIRNSLFFDSKEAEEEYLLNETSDDYTDEDKEYTERLSKLSTLDLKSIEEKIEDEQRLDKNGK